MAGSRTIPRLWRDSIARNTGTAYLVDEGDTWREVSWADAAADRTAVINTPGGGSSRNTRRPDLIAGVNPFIEEGGLLFLNPAAFAIPAPGAFGNLERNSIHGPNTRQIDMVVVKRDRKSVV